MDQELQHAAHLAQLRNALAGLMAHSRGWAPECADADAIVAELNPDGSVDVTFWRDGHTIAGMGA